MLSRIWLYSALAALFVTGSSTPSEAQSVRRSALNGTLFSATAIVSSGDARSLLFEVPAGRSFALTQACVSPLTLDTTATESIVIGPIFFTQTHVSGSLLGPLPVFGGCQSYEPGVLFQSGEQLHCETVNSGSLAQTCLVTGVLTSRSRHDRRRD